MAKQTKAQKPTVQEAVVENVENPIVEVVKTEIVPVNAGKSVVLFTPETKERLISAFVNAEVVKFDKTADDCKKLARKYAKLEVKDKDDVEGYKAVKAAYSELVTIRTSTEKARKIIVEPYSAIKSGIDAHAKENIVEVLAGTEAALKVQKDKFEKWEQEEKDRKEKEEQDRLDARIAELKEAGIAFDGELYSINDISVDVGTVKKMSEFDYQALLEKVKIEKKKNDDAAAKAQAEKEEQDRKDQEQREANERERKENRAEKLEIRTEKLEGLGFVTNEADEQYEFNKGGYNIKLTFDAAAEMNKAAFDDYVEKHNAVLEAIEEAEIEARTIQLIESRSQVLFALGVVDSEDGDCYFYEGVKIDDVDDEILGEYDASAWTALLENIKEQIADIKAKKDAKDAQAKEEQEAAEKEEREARLPDLEKVELYAQEIMKVALPQLKDTKAAELLADLKNNIKVAVDATVEKIKELS